MVVLGAASAPARAETYDNKSVPLAFETPASFAIRPATMENMDLALDIVPTGDFPARAPGESNLCGLYYRAGAADKTQQWLNERFEDKAVREQARGVLAASMKVATEETFKLGDVVGQEVVGLEVTGPLIDNPAVTASTSLLVTPRGRLQMICQIRTDQADKVLPVVRAIRATIKPPK